MFREKTPQDHVLKTNRPNARFKRGSFAYITPYLLAHKRYVVLALISVCIAFMAMLSGGVALRKIVDDGFMDIQFHEKGTLMLVGSIVFLALGSFGRTYYVSWLGERVTTDIRQKLFQKLLHLDIHYFESVKAGELVSRLTTDLTLVQLFIGASAAIFLRNICLFFGGLALMSYSAPWLFMQTLVGIVIMMLPIIFLGRKVKALSLKAQEHQNNVVSIIDDVFNAMRTVQAFTQESFFTQLFKKSNYEGFALQEKRLILRSTLVMIVILLVFFFVCGIIYLGVDQVKSEYIRYGHLTSFIYFTLLVASTIGSFPELLTDAQKAAAALDRLQELENQSTSIKEPEKARSLSVTTRGIVAIHNINFAYPSNPNHKVVDHLTVSLSPGERLAIVGPSGAGKSTIFSLLLRFYDPQSGSIYLDGIDIKDLSLKELRNAIAIVPQDPDIFSLSIMDNILYGNPHAHPQDIQNVIDALHIDEIFKTLPHGPHTIVGNKGSRLSGGQKQRIIIARALLKKPRLLLLDEATSHLDAASEQIIQRCLTTFMRTCTTIVIAHRLSTVLSCDRILVMKNGQMDSIGTHAELIVQDGLYRQLATLQFQELSK